jgi:LPS-assembly lipoprotein
MIFARPRLVYVAALVTALMLSGCGFKLRGSGGTANLPFKTIHVGLPDASPLGTELRRNIAAGDSTTIAADPKSAEAIVDVLSETRDKEILSLNSQGRVREHALLYRVVFRVRGENNSVLIPPTELVIRRSISFNESQVLAKETEEASLYRDMQSDMVRQILRRIAALKPAGRPVQ